MSSVWVLYLCSRHVNFDTGRIGERYGALTLIILYLILSHVLDHYEANGMQRRGIYRSDKGVLERHLRSVGGKYSDSAFSSPVHLT